MLSSYLAQLGLEAAELGNPYIACNISQSQIIEKLKSSLTFRKAWEETLRFANSKIPGNEQGVIVITLYNISLTENCITEICNNFDLSTVKDYSILSFAAKDKSDFVKVNVRLLLF